MNNYDPIPGSLDGPPAPEKQSFAELVGITLALAILLALAMLVGISAV